MIQRIRDYVNQLFANAPQTKRAMELREEVCSNLIDKFVDLTGHGMSEEDAYNAAVASIGDIDELFDTLKREQEQQEDPQVKRRSALLVSVAVALYICSVIPVILSDIAHFDSDYGVVAMFALCAVATALLVYNAMTRPKYHRTDDTMVEEFKEWKHEQGQGRYSSTFGAVSGALWTLVVAIYFIISFMFGIWAYSWIIFLIAAAVQQIIRAIYSLYR